MKVIDMHSHIWLSKYESDKADILRAAEAKINL